MATEKKQMTIPEEEAMAQLQEFQTGIGALINLRQEHLNSDIASKDSLRAIDFFIKEIKERRAPYITAFAELIHQDNLRFSAIRQRLKKGKPLGVKGGTAIFLNRKEGGDVLHVGGDPDKDFLERLKHRQEFFENYFIKEAEWQAKLEKCLPAEKKK